jgi:hypothetical protein
LVQLDNAKTSPAATTPGAINRFITSFLFEQLCDTRQSILVRESAAHGHRNALAQE